MKELLRQKLFRHLALGVLALVIMLLPFAISDAYYVSVLVVIGIHAIVVIGLSLLMGYAGQISLGHAAFYGLGAYASGILTTHYHLNPWLAMLLGAVGTGLLAFMIGRPIFRLQEHYLALATLGLGLIIHVVFMEEVKLTGGPSGLTGIPYLSLGSVSFDNDFKYYFLVWGLVLTALVIANNVVHSRIGRALRSIHGSEFAAQSLGVDSSRYKLQIFALSAVFASVAGSLYTHYITFISPSPFGMDRSVQFVVMAVVGGLGSVWGPLVGAAGITVLTEWLREVVQQLLPNAGGEWEIVVFGLILMVVMIFLPNGLTAGLTKLGELTRKERVKADA